MAGSMSGGMWKSLDRVQVLGNDVEGHRGCVNALSWSQDGSTLLSGSDDTRLCIWTPDPSSPSSSPHPLRLADVISTGHTANIFSARYLPNAAVPTIISCAGDHEIRVFDVERLGRVEDGVVRGRRATPGDLNGWDGPGTTVLKCHRDRTKRLATETSPFIFLSVSEDGTVRQHDLRRPHRCRTECPEALFRAPQGVDLYSLSVSTVTPHMFAVAGRTDCAYVCDRRMARDASAQWGQSIRESGQVHCVRRLGLSDEQWNATPRRQASEPYAGEKHITCVKMSPHCADEVICAFAQHSTALFSLHDSPGPSSMRAPRASRSPEAPAPPSPRSHTAPDFLRGSRTKRRRSPLGSGAETTADGPAGQVKRTDDRPDLEHMRDLAEDLVAAYREAELEGELEDGFADLSDGGDEEDTLDEDMDGDAVSAMTEDEEIDGDDDRRELDWEDEDEDEDDEFDMDEYDDDELDDDGLGDESEPDYYGPLSAHGEFAGVALVAPRRLFKGARNSETVKDCNFLGERSDKIASGSDDGNFFVWDKDTGRLEGIWEGDGSVVNVMEQHPTLPIVATSGIDNSIKIFAPTSQRPTPSFARTHLADTILQRNLSPAHVLQPIIDMRTVRLLARNEGLYASLTGDAGAGDCPTQ
ncbi:hypothetical protein Q5752_006787 [Cryptotrichosporon argae]